MDAHPFFFFFFTKHLCFLNQKLESNLFTNSMNKKGLLAIAKMQIYLMTIARTFIFKVKKKKMLAGHQQYRRLITGSWLFSFFFILQSVKRYTRMNKGVISRNFTSLLLLWKIYNTLMTQKQMNT